MTSIEFIQHWYAAHCKGDWAHDERIRLTSLDNPGWYVIINLDRTELSGKAMAECKIDISDNDWIMCYIRDDKFEGAGDPFKLERILEKFQEFASQAPT